MKGKTVIIVLILLMLCCCFGSIVFTALFGNFEANGKCVYSGTMATKTGACALNNSSSSILSSTSISSSIYTSSSNTSTSSYGNVFDNPPTYKSYIGKYSYKYTFSYPNTFFVDDTNTDITVYATNPVSDPKAGSKESMNITSKSGFLDLTSAECTNFANSVSSSLGSTYKVVDGTVKGELTSTNNFAKICKGSWDSVASGIQFHYLQYIASNKRTNLVYILTIVTTLDSTYQSKYVDIVNSFRVI